MSDDLDNDAKLQKVIEKFDVSPILKRFGSWAVTTYGIECLMSYYPIDFSRVNESDWVRHMRGKNWVNLEDFTAALSHAKDLYAMRRRLSIDGRPLKVFLCHGSEDKPAVRELHHRLLSIGTDPWLDEEKLVPGHNWKLEIDRALRKSDIVLACLSHETVSKTGFVQRELKDAIDAASERPEGQIFIIPARLNECTLPNSLQDLQRADLFLKDGFDQLIRALELFSASKAGS